MFYLFFDVSMKFLASEYWLSYIKLPCTSTPRNRWGDQGKCVGSCHSS